MFSKISSKFIYQAEEVSFVGFYQKMIEIYREKKKILENGWQKKKKKIQIPKHMFSLLCWKLIAEDSPCIFFFFFFNSNIHTLYELKGI